MTVSFSRPRSKTISAVRILVTLAGGRGASGYLSYRTSPDFASTKMAEAAFTPSRGIPPVPAGSPTLGNSSDSTAGGNGAYVRDETVGRLCAFDRYRVVPVFRTASAEPARPRTRHPTTAPHRRRRVVRGAPSTARIASTGMSGSV